MKQHEPAAQIAAGNRWYLADQFKAQLGSRGRRRVIEDRWRVFDGMLREWRARRQYAGLVRLLDAGCGDGINLAGLSRQSASASSLRLVGVDYNPVRLARARVAGGAAPLQQASLYELPFRDAAFDAVLCNHVLEHVPELPRALAELVRVLRPGGLLIVGVPNEGCLMGRARNRYVQPAIGRTTDHVHFFTASSLVAALRATGLAVQQVERETFFFPCSYINACCNEFQAGHWLMGRLRALLPSQAGGLIAAADKPDV